MTVFVDTSGLYALLDRDDGDHPKAARAWVDLLDSDATLLTTNYVLIETAALVQRRIGLPALRALTHDIVPALDVAWITAELHAHGMEAVLIAARRNLSVVDCTSFRVMTERQATIAFALDRHFREQGFALVP